MYYRLNVVALTIPSLRERKEDLPLLINYFIKKYSKHLGISEPDISQEVVDLLMKYNWQGNVRELENVVEHALVFSSANGIIVQSLPEHLRRFESVQREEPLNLNDKDKIDYQDTVAEFERSLIKWAHKRANGNQVHMAEILGIPRTTLRNKMIKLNLSQ